MVVGWLRLLPLSVLISAMLSLAKAHSITSLLSIDLAPESDANQYLQEIDQICFQVRSDPNLLCAASKSFGRALVNQRRRSVIDGILLAEDDAFMPSRGDRTLHIAFPGLGSIEDDKRAIRQTIDLFTHGRVAVSNDDLWPLYDFANWADFDCVVHETVGAMGRAFGACQWIKAYLLGHQPEPALPLSWIEWAHQSDVVRDEVVRPCLVSAIRCAASLPVDEFLNTFTPSAIIASALRMPAIDLVKPLLNSTNWMSKFAETEDAVFEQLGKPRVD
jgi:hypothetical protein